MAPKYDIIPTKYEIDGLHSQGTTGRKRNQLNAWMDRLSSKVKVNQRSHPQKAHLHDMTLMAAKYETDWLHSKGTIGWKRRVKEYTSKGHGTKVKGQSKVIPHKVHLLDMTFISAKYETNGLHGQRTIDGKRKQDVWTYVG